MAQVISFKKAYHSTGASGPRSPIEVVAETFNKEHKTVYSDASQQPSVKRDVFHAILLLDLAVQNASLVVKQISDPSRRVDFDAQIATIEQLLQLVRGKALKL